MWESFLPIALQQGPSTLILGVVCFYLYKLLQQERIERQNDQTQFIAALKDISVNMTKHTEIQEAAQNMQEKIVRFIIDKS